MLHINIVIVFKKMKNYVEKATDVNILFQNDFLQDIYSNIIKKFSDNFLILFPKF